MRPLVSVIVPSYNDERFIAQALSSVFAQTYQHVQVILIDDGSRDGTVAIARGFGERVKVIEQANAGSAAARNRGIAAADGDYVAFLDADDYWLPDKIARQVELLAANSACSFVYCSWVEWRWPTMTDPLSVAKSAGQGTTPIVPSSGSGWLYPQLLLDCGIQTSTVLVRKSLLQEVGPFDESLRRGQDYDYWLRCSRVTPILQVAEVLSLYRLREDSITNRPHEINYGGVLLERAIRRWGVRDDRGRTVHYVDVRRRLGKVWRDFAVTHTAAGNRRLAWQALTRALTWWPFDYASWLGVAKWLRFKPGSRQQADAT